jgi:hypothetical protein
MPCSPLKVNRRFGGTYCLYLQMKAIHSSEKSLDFISTTPYYIAEEGTRHIHRCENQKSNNVSRTVSFQFCFISLKIHRWFKRKYCLHNYGRVIKQARNQHEEGNDMVHEISADFHLSTLPLIPRNSTFINEHV